MNQSAVGVWALLAAIGSAQNVPTFPGRAFDAGWDPQELELVDFDRDGALDALYSASGGRMLSRGDGQGGFFAPNLVSTEGAAYSMVVDDFNADGWPDVATSHGAGGDLKWALGNGSGGLSSYQFQAGWSVGQLLGADIDGDGVKELLVLEWPLAIRVLRWQSSGFVQVGSESVAGLNLVGWTPGDFDGDGRGDLALWINAGPAQQRRLTYLFGDGTGAFPRRELGVQHPWSGYQVFALDVDGDGTDEVVTAGSDALREYRRIAPQRYREELRNELACEIRGVGDLDGDGDGDLIYSDLFGRVFVARGGVGGLALEPKPLWIIDSQPGGLRFGDLNGDARADLVAAHQDHGLTVVLANSSGALPHVSGVGPMEIDDVVMGDLNGDGALDLLAGEGAQLVTRLNDGSGQFTQLSSLSVPAQPGPWQLCDLDGDGDLDVFAVFSAMPGLVLTALNDGGGNMAAPQLHGKAHSSKVLPGDCNADGWLDLIEFGLSLHVRLGNGSGGFFTPVVSPSAGLGSFPVFHVADVDSDGHDDVIVGANNAPPRLEIFRGGPTARLRPRITTPLNAVAYGFVDGDFNADGRTDLVWWGADGLKLAHGAGTASLVVTATLTPPGGAPSFTPRVARVDSDNRDDLWSTVSLSNTWGNPGVGVAVLLSDATGRPSSYARFFAGNAAEILAVANFAADSRAELVVRHGDNGRVQLVRQQ
ncbi:MAG: VCBS repeat-containing protein [Planctomycetes bacterium]|nr:VCBS repeat-containing protein [Planctomycetota bacterium]